MKKIISFVLIAMVVLSGLPVTALAAPDDPVHYSYADLVDMMTDLERLSLLPEEGERSGEASSYDRGSRYDEETDTYINWDWNGDGRGVIANLGDVPGKGTKYLVADLEGPGVIWRTWSAQADGGLIEVYIDGEEEPSISRPFRDMFNNTGAPFNYDGLCYVAAQGKNCFVPVSYNESCKVYLYGSWGNYYQFTWTQFAPGTTVEPMPKTLSETDSAALERANLLYSQELGKNPNDLSGGTRREDSFTVEAGGTADVLSCDGQGALAEFKVKVDEALTYDEMWDAVQELTVSMYWDGEAEPSVWAPLGDFFGTPCGDFYTTLPMGYRKDGWFYCYFHMPFENGARIVIGNDGERAYKLLADTTVVPAGDIQSRTRFHAKWNKDVKQPTRPDVWPDYTVLKTEGRGRFLGFLLHVFEKGSYGWWGEGDEKFFVDGEKFPSSFGTGSEDYFGYAWCDPSLFTDKALHAQAHNEGGVGGPGNKVNIRFQTTDNVPFQQSFDAYIEKYYNDTMAEYSVTPYWYLAPGGLDDYGPVSLSGRTDYFFKPEFNRLEVEGENMRYWASEGARTPINQSMTSWPGEWSGGRQVLWQNSDPEADIFFAFDVPRQINGMFKLRSTMASDFGIYQLYLDGEPIGEPVDLYYNRVVNSGYILIENVALTAGEHILSARAVGKNDKATSYTFAVDCIVIDSAKPVPGMIEGEDMRLKDVTAGGISIQKIGQIFSGGTWSRDEQLWWTGGSKDASITLGFELDQRVDNRPLIINYTKAVDYGSFQLYIDGQPVGDVQNAFNNGVTNQTVTLSNITLEAGPHELKAVLTGKDDRSTGYMFGLDYIRFDGMDGDNVYLEDVGNLDGRAGTQFKVPVKLSGYPSGDYKSIEGIVRLPAGAVLADAIPSRFVTSQNFDYAVDGDGTLRFIFLSTDGSNVVLDTQETNELLTLVLELKENMDEGEQLELEVAYFGIKNRDHAIDYKLENAKSIITIASSGHLKAFTRTLYAGDGIDLIPAGKMAVAVEFTALDGTPDVSLFGKQFYFSAEKTGKTGKTTYVGLIDTDVDIDRLDIGTYTMKEDADAQTIAFGDTDGDGQVNAQDALAIVSAWLRKTGAPDEKGILIMNVSADSAINTTDAVELIQSYVNGREFTVISK